MNGSVTKYWLKHSPDPAEEALPAAQQVFSVGAKIIQRFFKVFFLKDKSAQLEIGRWVWPKGG